MCGKNTNIPMHAHACYVFMVVLLPASVKNCRLLLSNYDTASFIACRISNVIASVTHLNQKKL